MLILSFYGENVKDKRGFVAYIAKTDDAAPAEETPDGESDKPPAEEKIAE
jgi:hypothetical protein